MFPRYFRQALYYVTTLRQQHTQRRVWASGILCKGMGGWLRQHLQRLFTVYQGFTFKGIGYYIIGQVYDEGGGNCESLLFDFIRSQATDVQPLKFFLNNEMFLKILYLALCLSKLSLLTLKLCQKFSGYFKQKHYIILPNQYLNK